jgi:hypothetical protein
MAMLEEKDGDQPAHSVGKLRRRGPATSTERLSLQASTHRTAKRIRGEEEACGVNMPSVNSGR